MKVQTNIKGGQEDQDSQGGVRIVTNHNQTLVQRPAPIRIPNHNQTVVRASAPIRIANHNQTVVRSTR